MKRGKQQSHKLFHFENKIYKKIDNILIIIIAFNHRRGKIIFFYIYNQEYGKVGELY